MGRKGGIKKNSRKLSFHPDDLRRKIEAGRMLQLLQDHIFGKLELSVSRIRGIEILLRKCIPDLSAATVTADINVRYVAELPKMLTREEWMAKYGTDHLDLTAEPLPITNGSGNGKLQ